MKSSVLCKKKWGSVKDVMICVKHRYYQVMVTLTLSFLNVKAFAAIPSAPSIGNGSSGDYIKTANSIGNEALGYIIIFFFVGAILGYIAGVLYLLSRAKKHDEWGKFGKGFSIGLIVLVFVLILLNVAKTSLGPS